MTRVTISNKSFKKYGFFFSLLITIGSVVGISIFFKNYQVFTIVEGDSTLIISAWILGALVSFFTALSFIDISRLSLKSKMPFRKWCSMFIGKRYSNFIGIVALMYAYAIVLPTLYYYSYSFMIQAFGGTPTLPGSIVALVVLPVTMFAMNIYAEKGSALFSQLTTIMKILPLILVALVGLFFTSNGGGFSSSQTLFNAKPPSFTTLLFALPPILFTFDGFLTITNVAHKTKNAKRNIPLSVVIGMAIISCLYLFVTISQINHASPTIQLALNNIFKNKYLTTITLFFIAISAFSVSNIVTMSAKITCQSLIDDDILPFSSFYKQKFKKGSDTGGGIVMMIVTILTALVLMLGQSLLVNSGVINNLTRVQYNDEARKTSLMLDEFSNYPTYFFYIFYCSVIVGNLVALIRGKLRKNATKEEKKAFNDLFQETSIKRRNIVIVISAIASIMIIFILVTHFFYNIFYIRIIYPFTNNSYLTPDEKWDILLFFINLWLLQFIPLVCLFRSKKLSFLRWIKKYQNTTKI